MRRARFLATGPLAIEQAAWGLEFAVGGAAEAEPFRELGAFAVVDVRGPLTTRPEPVLFGAVWDSYEAIRGRVEAALASSSPAVLLRLDSPGGHVAGCFELADELRRKAAAAGKPLVAYVDGCATSAAYALACAADRICVPPTGVVGSVGVIKVAVDTTAADRAAGYSFAVIASGSRKADGNPHVPMTEGALLAMQGEVDAMAIIFFDLVARSRRTSAEKVARLEAGTFIGAAAVSAGLADEVITFDALIGGASKTKATARAGAAEEKAMTKAELRAALKALAAEGDKEAEEALKAFGGDEGDGAGDGEEKPKDKDGAKASDVGEEKPKDEGGEEKPDAKASASLGLAATVQSLSAKVNAWEEKEERAKLMASRPDLAPEVVAFLGGQPLAVVRAAVKELPRGPAPKAVGGQVGAARAALAVAPLTASSQGEPASLLPEAEAQDLKVQMGLAPRASAIRNDGTMQTLGVMTPAEARAELAARAKKEATR